MISGTATKFRLVKCPKCRKLLPEVAEFPVYQCGGCGVFLRGNMVLCIKFKFDEPSYRKNVYFLANLA